MTSTAVDGDFEAVGGGHDGTYLGLNSSGKLRENVLAEAYSAGRGIHLG